MIEPGNTATITFTTNEEATATALGSGDLPVLATPKVVALVEEAAVTAIARFLGDTDTTVGAHVEIDHLAPTPVGGTVTATAAVIGVKGRRVEFEATVVQGATVVAKARHTRFVVNRESFMNSVRT